MIAGRWLVLSTAALLLAACGNAASTPSKPPTAQEILNKPDKANVRDAHFTLVAHIVSGSTAFDATGDGIIVIKPQQELPRKNFVPSAAA